MILRIIVSMLLLVSIFILPYWLYLIFMLAAIVYFDFFWEAVVLGFIVDTVYATGLKGVIESFPVIAVSAVVLVILSIQLRDRFRL